MKDLQSLLKGTQDRLIKQAHGDFPSYAHEVAWMLAEEFKEPYGYWVRIVTHSVLNPGQIKYEFENLKGKGFTRRQKVKMLVAAMKVKTGIKTHK